MIASNQPDLKNAFDEWMSQGPEPTNGDVVRHHKVDLELLHHLAEFIWNKARSTSVTETDPVSLDARLEDYTYMRGAEPVSVADLTHAEALSAVCECLDVLEAVESANNKVGRLILDWRYAKADKNDF